MASSGNGAVLPHPSISKLSHLGHDFAKIEFNKSIAGCYRDGDAEYDAVGVLLITWKEDDMGCREKEVDRLQDVFDNYFHYNTEQCEIPPVNSSQVLLSRLDAFIRCYESPNKLGIVYYGGHARPTKDGTDLELFSRPLSKEDLDRLELSDSPVECHFKETFWAPGSTPNSPVTTASTTNAPGDAALEPISLQQIFDKLTIPDMDIFFVADCCHAAAAYTQQPFGGRKCELMCSIAPDKWAAAAGRKGSFTTTFTKVLQDLIQKRKEGFSTSDLYRQVYLSQPRKQKPFHFKQSRFDYGTIVLRPLPEMTGVSNNRKSDRSEEPAKYSIDISLQLTQSVDLVELNQMAKALQYIPHVRKIDFQSFHSPIDKMQNFMMKVLAAKRLRPLLARIRRMREVKQVKQLQRTESSSSLSSDSSILQFFKEEPRDVGLCDWSASNLSTARGRYGPDDMLEFNALSESESGGFAEGVLTEHKKAGTGLGKMAVNSTTGTRLRLIASALPRWLGSGYHLRQNLPQIFCFTLGFFSSVVLQKAGYLG